MVGFVVKISRCLLLSVLFLAAHAAGDEGVLSLTEENFAEHLRNSASALVGFVAPWCSSCRSLMSELTRVQKIFVARASPILIAQCDVSREIRLAARYHVSRTPIVLLFPDTRLLSYGLQVHYTGGLSHGNLADFASWAPSLAFPRVSSPLDVLKLPGVFAQRAAARSNAGSEEGRETRSHRQQETQDGQPGAFVAFLRSENTTSALQDLWPLDCVKRHPRGIAIVNASTADADETLWKWIGLEWDAVEATRSEEAIFYVPGGVLQTADGHALQRPSTVVRFPNRAAARGLGWREQVEEFCIWCERQTLGPVAVFEARRAAALENSFEWLLFLFEPSTQAAMHHGEDRRSQLHADRRRLEMFMSQNLYEDLLPVIVPAAEVGASELQASLLGAISATHDDENDGRPLLLQDRTQRSGVQGALDCVNETDASDPHSITSLVIDSVDAVCSGSDGKSKGAVVDDLRGTSRAPWLTVLFNTRTRLKYRFAGAGGWTTGDEESLGRFLDAAVDGRVMPHYRSVAVPPKGGAPKGVVELVGASVGKEALEPVADGHAELLLFLYAPWCGHSLNFIPVWHQLAAALRDGVGKKNHLVLAQMDASTNEHPLLPPVARFPTLLRCVPLTSLAASRQVEICDGDVGWPSSWSLPDGSPIHYIPYCGAANLSELLGWARGASV